jgi:hypothetical protein
MYRQGDVFLTPIENIPLGARFRLRKDQVRHYSDGKHVRGIVLAAGEATGHHHVVKERSARLFDMPGRRFLRITNGTKIDSWKVRKDGEEFWIPIDVPRGKIEAAGFTIVGREIVKGVTVRHEEHLALVVLPGDYEITRQREYEPPQEQSAPARSHYVYD